MTSQASFFDVTNWREQMLIGGRVVVWYSCGVTSAVAARLSLRKYLGTRPVHVVYCDTGSEHPDNARFTRDVEEWLGVKIEVLKNPKYRDVDDVIEKDRYLNGPGGAKCTGVLKKAMRHRYQRADSDIQVFGFDAAEESRAADFRRDNPEVWLETPLIEQGITKADCLAIIREAGIETPAMYALGYKNNNCIGCVKGGMGYWNKIRTDFPDVFARRAAQERHIGATCLRSDKQPVFLDELDPSRGNYEAEDDVECGVLCRSVVQEVSCEV
jgi:3'-phosphoadenosine 5'-phosphosulfate sulfotransferase (PAPS reductase)/FAD synthetase